MMMRMVAHDPATGWGRALDPDRPYQVTGEVVAGPKPVLDRYVTIRATPAEARAIARGLAASLRRADPEEFAKLLEELEGEER